jgi:hypothetical protein
MGYAAYAGQAREYQSGRLRYLHKQATIDNSVGFHTAADFLREEPGAGLSAYDHLLEEPNPPGCGRFDEQIFPNYPAGHVRWRHFVSQQHSASFVTLDKLVWQAKSARC